MLRRTVAFVFFVMISVVVFSAASFAAGGTVHIYMSELAIDMVRDPELKEFLERNREVVLWGSWYPDSGYVSGNQYGEFSHWSDFQDAYFDYIRDEIGPEHEDFEFLVAHLMGAAAHGLEDQTFDNIFLARTGQEDGTGQEELDRGLDMVCMVEHRRDRLTLEQTVSANPAALTPIAHLGKIYERLGMEYADIEKQIFSGQKMLALAIMGEKMFAGFESGNVRQESPWAVKNYFEAPGGVRHSARVVAAYWESMWRRAHGDYEFGVINTFPEDGGELLSGEADSVSSDISVVFSNKYDKESINENTLWLENADGKRLESRLHWGYASNVLRVSPVEDLERGARYSIHITSEVADKDEVVMAVDFSSGFSVPE